MPLLNDADMIYMGATEVDAVYHGSELVWENNPIIQERIDIVECNDVLAVKGAWSGNFGFYSAVDPPGSTSVTHFKGHLYSDLRLYVRNNNAETRSGANHVSFYIRFPRGTPITKAELESVTRVYIQDYGWVDKNALNGTEQWHALEENEHDPVNGSASTTAAIRLLNLNNDIPRWNGSGSSYIILEYTV